MKSDVRKYLSKIASKVGRAGKGTKQRKQIARKAALARWKAKK